MRKKLFAILMSAMMMVTFMPAMAFATLGADEPQWNGKFTSVDYGYTNYATTRVFNNDGTITATSESIPGLTKAKTFTDGTVVVSSDATHCALQKTYIDLDGAYIAAGTSGDASAAIAFARKTAIEYNSELARYVSSTSNYVPAYVVTVRPSDITSGDAMEVLSGGGWSFTLDTIIYDENNKYADQDFTLNVNMIPADSHVKVFGALATKTIKVLATTAHASDAKYGVSGANTKTAGQDNLTTDYDGEAHVVSQVAMTGVTSAYKVWDKATAEYVAATEVSATDAGTYKFQAKATKAATATTAKEETGWLPKEVTVVAANLPTMEFDTSDAAGNKVFSVAEGFDAAKYLVLTPDTTDPENYFDWNTYSWKTKEVKKAASKIAADAKAIAANEELLKAYFNDFFEIKQTVDKYDATKIVAEIVKKDMSKLTTAEKDAFVAKYAAMFANFGKTLTRGNVADATAFFLGNAGDKATFNVTNAGDIEWVKAPLTKKYYNKKGTLKKTYTFAVEAKADCKVTYKLSNGGEMIKIDKNTGKVTVKKGLKVGTYKVAITAKAGKSTETYELVIKMAKKK